MFRECKSLIFLPDITKWNFSNVFNVDNIIKNCISLSFLYHDFKAFNDNNFNCINIKKEFY